MRKVGDAKTRLVPERIAAIGLVLVAVAGLVLMILWPSNGQPSLRIGQHRYSLDVASDETTRSKGLGGRTTLARSKGMLFVFDGEAVRCFWMKDMHFSLDIIWLDAQKKVVHIENNVSPDTFPKSYCQKQPAQYVIELRAGEANRSGINPGKKLNISSLD